MFGPYWTHIKIAWGLRDHPNYHICCYDTLKKNPKEEYRKIATFLEKDISDEDLDKVRLITILLIIWFIFRY